MATTGFWPVTRRLKYLLGYAENPEKTSKKMYVTAINCSKLTAYEEMIAIKKRFREKGRNIAYHGFQSFRPGEVTAEECHEIGVETARRMWGKDYQVVVTTHLNTDNYHNHFVGAPIRGRVNPLSKRQA